MKISSPIKPSFTPITLTIETEEEYTYIFQTFQDKLRFEQPIELEKLGSKLVVELKIQYMKNQE